MKTTLSNRFPSVKKKKGGWGPGVGGGREVRERLKKLQ